MWVPGIGHTYVWAYLDFKIIGMHLYFKFPGAYLDFKIVQCFSETLV